MKTKPNKIFKFSSLALSFLLVISLLSGIFYPDVLIERAYAVTALTNVTDTPTSTKISTSTSHKIDFTTYTTVPIDGKIVITFPTGFNVASAAFSAWSGFDGNKTVSVSGQVVTVTRTTGGTASTAGGKYITLSGITNTASVNTNYTVTVETQNSAATTLDGPTTSFYFSICTNACHTATYQIPWTSTVSVSGKHTTKFTTASAIPADGKIKITFPSGFDISGATFDSWSDFDGSQSLVINGQTITITRDNTGTSTAAGAKYIILNNIVNHSTAGSAYYATLETMTSGDVNIEGPTSIRFSINSTGVGLANTAWPSIKGNNLSQSRGTVNTSDYYTMKWRNSELGGSHRAEVVIGLDGTLYTGNLDNKVYAINASTGATIWTYTTGDAVGTPAISADGNIHVSSYDGYLYTLDSNGNLQWKYYIGVNGDYNWVGLSGPKIGDDGTIYASGGGSFYAFDPHGTLKWQYSGGISKGSSPAIANDNTIYQVGGSGVLALNPDGTTKWNSAAGTWRGPVAVADDGTVYTLHLKAISPTSGSINWDYGRGGSSHNAGGMAISTDGSIYFGEYYGSNLFHSVNSSGVANWTYGVGRVNYGSASVDLSGEHIYIHSSYGAPITQLYSFDKNGNLKWNKSESVAGGDQYGGGVTIDSDGSLYVTSHEGGLSRLQPWTLTSSLNRSDYYNPGDTISFTATTSMLTTDPVTAEANQAQVYLSDGTIVPLTYVSTNSSGNTVWTGTHTISSGKPNGTYTATFEASAVNVETDTTTHFASAPTNTNNTGITSSLSYTVKKQSASAPSLDAPRPSDLPNSPEPVLADADQKPTPPKASKYNPDGGFDLLLNGGAKTTPNPEVSLYLFGGPDTKYTQISEDPTFKGAKQEKYTSHKHWQLKDNKLGKHTIYIRYLTLYDVSSETVSQSILLTKTTPPSSPPSQAATPSVPICTTTIIKTGDTLWDLAVRYFNQGSLYPNLINLNKNIYSSLIINPSYLRPGWKLSVKCE